MARYIPQISSETKTYVNEAGAIKRAEAICAGRTTKLTYIIMQAENGRYVPVFIGTSAIEQQIHFQAHVVA